MISAGIVKTGLFHRIAEGIFGHARNKRSRIMILAALCALAGLIVAGSLHFRGIAPNFGCVEPGKLYRSGQPGRRALRLMLDQHGLRTIVCLRSVEKLRADRLGRQEMLFAQQNGIKLIVMPYGHTDPVEQAHEFLRIMADPSNHPVLVHCAAGEERSGVMTAIYRMAVNGWTPAEAIREMQEYGFEPEKKPEMARVVETFPATLPPGGVGPTSPPPPTHTFPTQ